LPPPGAAIVLHSGVELRANLKSVSHRCQRPPISAEESTLGDLPPGAAIGYLCRALTGIADLVTVAVFHFVVVAVFHFMDLCVGPRMSNYYILES